MDYNMALYPTLPNPPPLLQYSETPSEDRMRLPLGLDLDSRSREGLTLKNDPHGFVHYVRLSLSFSTPTPRFSPTHAHRHTLTRDFSVSPSIIIPSPA
ncbi:hypothetical protein PoB_007473100 [Plakobranchus ocellatus]|uniref:Uncharacterized protein n=1 Tax=Plakobranchus ocellatus TaxID=259542 RepID=A0AAV4DWL5_9GAST|nr:hypothetical protein PoB_007473100 [Plakobranchus ocellatus]